MLKKFTLLTMAVALLALLVMPGHARAAEGALAGWGSPITIAARELGNNPGGDFTPSNNVQVFYQVDASGQFFVVLSQHQRGNMQFGAHSNGGTLRSRAVATMGIWEASNLPANPTALPGTDFPAATWN